MQLTVIDGPGESPGDVDPVQHARGEDVVEVGLDVIRATEVPEDLGERVELGLGRVGEAELGDDDAGGGGEVFLCEEAQERPDAAGGRVQPCCA